jgi:hypothetical protein
MDYGKEYQKNYRTGHGITDPKGSLQIFRD